MKLSRLKAVREQKGLTQEQLARLCNMTARSISRIENGRGCFLNNVKALSKALKTKLEELL